MGQRGQDIDLKMAEEYNQLKPHSALGYRPPGPEAILTLGISNPPSGSHGAG